MRRIRRNRTDYIHEYECDICGRKAEFPDTWEFRESLREEPEDVGRKVSVTVSIGVSLVTSGGIKQKTEVEVDLCPTCFKKEVLLPLTKKGVIPRVSTRRVW